MAPPPAPLLPLLLAALAAGRAAAQFVRPYYGGGPLTLNTTTLQYDVDASVEIAADFDLATIDADSWGVPWDSFIYEQPLPRSWETKLNQTVDAWRTWNRALLLLLPMGDADSKRSCPAQNATDGPTGLPVLNAVGNCKQCFDYNETTNPVAAFFRQGYVNYVLAMAAAFTLNAPSKNAPLVGLGFALDANRVLEAGCGDAWLRAYADFSNQIYATVKQYLPELAIFPAFQLESLYGLREGQACNALAGAGMAAGKPAPALLACFDANYEAVAALRRDVFAFTASPTAYSGGQWAPWYLTAALDRLEGPVDTVNRWVVGTGILGDELVVNAQNSTGSGKQPPPECLPVIAGSADGEAAWLASVVAAATAYEVQLVTLAQARDILTGEVVSSCPCSAPGPLAFYCDYINYVRVVCAQFGLPSFACEAQAKVAGTTGVRDLEGNEKEPVYSTLQAARAAGGAGAAPPLGEGHARLLRRLAR